MVRFSESKPIIAFIVAWLISMIGCAEKFETITTDCPKTSVSEDAQKRAAAPVSERSVLTQAQAEERVIKNLESRLSHDAEIKQSIPLSAKVIEVERKKCIAMTFITDSEILKETRTQNLLIAFRQALRALVDFDIDYIELVAIAEFNGKEMLTFGATPVEIGLLELGLITPEEFFSYHVVAINIEL
jgi:hypothetical protein